MRRFLIPAASVGLVLPAAPAHAQDVLHLQPSTPWVLDYAEEHCRLARNFGDGDQLVTLILDQFEPGDWFRISLTGKPVEASRTKKDSALQFGPNEPAAEIAGTIATVDRNKPAFLVDSAQRLAPLNAEEKRAQEAARKNRISFEPTPIGPEREAAATWLELRNAFRQDLRLEIGPMDKPLAALRDCSWDAVRSWGLDVEQQKTLSRKPIPNEGDWFAPTDYPTSMLRSGDQGIVNFRLLVDRAGKPTICKIQVSTRPKAFDDAVCNAVMRRARFQPALDAHGNPVPSYWRQTVVFKLCC